MAAILGVGLCYTTTLHMLQTIAPLFLHDGGFSPVALGLVIAFPSLFQVVLRIPAGAASDRLGEKTILLASTMAMAAAAGLYLTGGMVAIIVAQGLTGMSRAAFWPCAQSYTTKVPGEDIGRRIGLFHALTGVGNAIGPVLAGACIARFDYRGAFAVMGIGAALSFAAVRFMPPVGSVPVPCTARKGASLSGGIAAIGRTRPVILAAACRYAAAFPMALLGSFLLVYLADIGMSARQIGALSGLRGLSLMGAGLVFSAVFDRLPRRLLWFGGMAALAVSVMLIPLFAGFVPLTGCIVLMGLGSATMQILPLAMIAESTPPADRGKVIAATGTLWGLSLFVNPMLFGVVAETVSLRATFYVGGAPLAVLAVLTIPLFRWAYGARRSRLSPQGDEHDAGDD